MKKMFISIPEPCHENWQNMSPTEQGRFCASCQKEVVDFTALADTEIVQYFQKTKESTCGNFLPEQLDKAMNVPGQSKFPWKIFFQFLLPAFLFAQKTKAQNNQMSRGDTIVANTLKVGKVRVMQPQSTSNSIKGIIVDSITRQPIAAASVLIKNKGVGFQVDSLGNFVFDISAKENFLLEISCVGYETKIVSNEIINAGAIIIQLVPKEKVLEEVKVISYNTTIRGGAIKINYKTYVAGGAIGYDTISIYEKVKNKVTGKNLIRIYPNPVENSIINIGMKGMIRGEYLLQVITVAGSVLQNEKIQVPDVQFNFQLGLKNSITKGTYFVRVIAPDKRIIHNGKIVVL